MRLTVVVCTRNRAHLLGACLSALDAVREPGVELQVLVVDNGSTDGTAGVLGAASGVDVVQEPEPGLSRARNAGLRAARAPIVAFIDDDARPLPGWASALAEAIERFPAATAFGGPVHLALVGRRPRWLTPRLEGWYSALDLGAVPRLLAPDERPVGTNFAVDRDAALAVGGFDEELGRRGVSLTSEEEVELLTRMHAAGGATAWVPGARVSHVVTEERLRRRWLLERAWAQGRSDATVARRLGPGRSRAVSARDAAGAVVRGWPSTLRGSRAARDHQAMLLQDLVRRIRRLGRAGSEIAGR
jgi:glycosyltransferase involved in cell wall biosynthesis